MPELDGYRVHRFGEGPVLEELRAWLLLGEPTLALLGESAQERVSILRLFAWQLIDVVRVVTPDVAYTSTSAVCAAALAQLGERAGEDPESALVGRACAALDSHEGVVLLLDGRKELSVETARRLSELCERSRSALRLLIALDPGEATPALLEALGPDRVTVELGEEPEPRSRLQKGAEPVARLVGSSSAWVADAAGRAAVLARCGATLAERSAVIARRGAVVARRGAVVARAGAVVARAGVGQVSEGSRAVGARVREAAARRAAARSDRRAKSTPTAPLGNPSARAQRASLAPPPAAARTAATPVQPSTRVEIGRSPWRGVTWAAALLLAIALVLSLRSDERPAPAEVHPAPTPADLAPAPADLASDPPTAPPATMFWTGILRRNPVATAEHLMREIRRGAQNPSQTVSGLEFGSVDSLVPILMGVLFGLLSFLKLRPRSR